MALDLLEQARTLKVEKFSYCKNLEQFILLLIKFYKKFKYVLVLWNSRESIFKEDNTT